MVRVVIVPGLAVRGYMVAPARSVLARGHDVSLLAPPGWRSSRVGLAAYGKLLADQLERRGEHVDMLVGLSVGTQAAAVAAAVSDRVRHLLLVSPTVDPVYRTPAKLIERWLHGDPQDGAPGWAASIPDWAHAGVLRIAGGYLSALRLPIEDVLPAVKAPMTIVHAEHDSLGTAAWASRLARDAGADYRFLPGQPHSWPVDDGERFADTVEEMLS